MTPSKPNASLGKARRVKPALLKREYAAFADRCPKDICADSDRNSIALGIMAENYILVAGGAGGGNTTFQNHLVRYLISAKDNFSAELVLANRRDGRDIEDEWSALWSEGKLPKGAGQPKDYAYRVQPLGKHKDKPPLDFAFREISGTDLDTLLVTEEGATSDLSKELRALLGNPKLNIVLVLLCDGDEKAGEDDAHNQDASLAGFCCLSEKQL